MPREFSTYIPTDALSCRPTVFDGVDEMNPAEYA